ncbi:acyltransferase [Ganoderma leucocontextum]|nr:acyltransferase [Ganoderma leucocontextum]
MELKLVYRGLRQISDWALRYYSEVYNVDGEENVPHDGPLIITSCHHNEILDIATLAVTTPHGRPVCFWAKSTLFRNPLVGAILLSSGSIPVARNPNVAPVPSEQPGSPGPALSKANEALFKETIKALEREEVIGVFPEGTSYTEPSIAQVKDGASRAALAYVRWAQETRGGQGKRLQIVPVGVVYTDKTQYQSRVCVRWGKPIDVEAFVEEHGSEADGDKDRLDSRDVIKALTTEIEKRLLALTINAPDWDTLYATAMARDILWADDELAPSHFLWISQNLISQFTDPDAAPSFVKARQALLKYHSLLHHANISHASLNALLPDIKTRPSLPLMLAIVLRQLFVTVLHPRFALFLPALVLHIPAYAMGLLGGRMLGKEEEEESWAQFKAVFGGLAAAGAYAMVTRAIVRGLITDSVGQLARLREWVPRHLLPGLQSLWTAGRWFFTGNEGLSGTSKAALGILGVFYVTSFVLARWHDYWVGCNYRFKRLLTSFKLLLGVLSPQSSSLTEEELAPYTTPYVAPPNPYIKRREGAPAHVPTPNPPPVASRRLIRPLLKARAEATRSMWLFMLDSKYLHGLVSAKMRGEAWMQVGPAKRHEFQP